MVGRARWHDPVPGEVGGDDVRGNALRVEFAILLHAGAHDAELDRVEHAPVVGDVVEAVPQLTRMQHPARGFRGEQFCRRLVERNALACLRVLDVGRVPRREEPVLLPGELLVHARHGQPARHRLVDHVLRQRLTGRPVHHRGGDFVRGDQRVERGRARLRGVGFVEATVIDRLATVPDVDVGGLRERSEQLMRGMRREYGGAILGMLGGIAAHRVAVLVHRIEPRVGVPRFVEVDAIHALRESFLRVAGVVAHPIVGAVRHHRVDRALGGGALRQRVLRDAFRDGLGLEPGGRDRPDDAVAVARGAQEHGDAPADGEALLDGLVAIAVAQRDLAVAHTGAHDGPVRSRRAVQDRV